MLDTDQGLEQILDFQINKEPVTDDMVRDGTGKKKVARKRRSHDAQMFAAMTDYQVKAFQNIGVAFQSVVKGMTVKVMSYGERMAGSTNQNAEDWMATLQSDYFHWARAVQVEKLDHAICMDVIGYGKTLGHVDAERRMRKGSAKKNLLACLDVWCKMHGWPVEKGA